MVNIGQKKTDTSPPDVVRGATNMGATEASV
jgi:hypothetical protein